MVQAATHDSLHRTLQQHKEGGPTGEALLSSKRHSYAGPAKCCNARVASRLVAIEGEERLPAHQGHA